MALSERDIQAITYEISDRINNIPVTSLKDLQGVINALNGLLSHRQPTVLLRIQLSAQSVFDFIDPTFMAVHPNDQVEFEYQAHKVIKDKITILSRMSPEQVTEYILEQNTRREESKRGQEKQRLAKIPEGEARTVGYEQMLLRQYTGEHRISPIQVPGEHSQTRLNQLPEFMIENREVNRLVSLDFRTIGSFTRLTEEQFLRIHPLLILLQPSPSNREINFANQITAFANEAEENVANLRRMIGNADISRLISQDPRVIYPLARITREQFISFKSILGNPHLRSMVDYRTIYALLSLTPQHHTRAQPTLVATESRAARPRP